MRVISNAVNISNIANINHSCKSNKCEGVLINFSTFFQTRLLQLQSSLSFAFAPLLPCYYRDLVHVQVSLYLPLLIEILNFKTKNTVFSCFLWDSQWRHEIMWKVLMNFVDYKKNKVMQNVLNLFLISLIW